MPPTWKRGQPPLTPGFQASLTAGPIRCLPPSVQGDSTVTSQRAHYQGTITVQADTASHLCPRHHRDCCLTSSVSGHLIPASRKPLAVLLQDMTLVSPLQEGSCAPPRAPALHCPYLQVLTYMSCYCPLHAPQPRAPRMGGACLLQHGIPRHTHSRPGPEWALSTWLLKRQAQAEALLVSCPSWEQHSHTCGSQEGLLGLAHARGKGQRRRPPPPKPDANTPQTVASQPGQLRTTPWLLHIGANRVAPQALPATENGPHCVPGSSGRQSTAARRALGHGAAGSWPPMGVRLGELQPSDGYLGLTLGSASSGYPQTPTLGEGATWWLGVVKGEMRLIGSHSNNTEEEH